MEARLVIILFIMFNQVGRGCNRKCSENKKLYHHFKLIMTIAYFIMLKSKGKHERFYSSIIR